MPPSAINGTPRAFQGGGDIADRGNLRNADTGDDAGSADRAGAYADFDAVCACFDQGFGACGGGNIAAYHLYVRKILFDPAHPVQYALRVAMSSIDNNHVDTGVDQSFYPVVGIGAGADSRADT